MKRFLSSLAVAALVLLVGLPARAEVYVYGEVSKDKDVEVNEDVNIDKDIDIDVTVDVTLEKAAEADAVVNQENFDNEGCENCAEKLNLIDARAFANDDGVVNVNQATGNMNNQGNALSLSVDAGSDGDDGDEATPGALTHSQAAVAQDADSNTADLENIDYREDIIQGTAFIDVTGVVNVNQAAGNMNNQANAEAIALGGDSVVALSEADLGQFNTCNAVTEGGELGVYKSDYITGAAFFRFAGVAGVNQASGNMNNQTNTLSLSASIGNF
jgi:hypothetical protein